MTTPDILEIFAKRVETASSLDELYRALIAFQEEVETHHDDFADDVVGALAQYIDIDHLPTFGGKPPKNMDEVKSWDRDRLLVGTGPFWDWDFVEREETSEFRDVENTMKRRAGLARKAYRACLKDVYRSLREGSLPAHSGGINLMEQTIGAYFAMIQAKRDAVVGRAGEGEPIDKLVAAFDAWLASLSPVGG
jgi:hypothetical protein